MSIKTSGVDGFSKTGLSRQRFGRPVFAVAARTVEAHASDLKREFHEAGSEILTEQS